MKNLFETGTAVEIPAVLANRDRRVAVQQQLMTKQQTVLAVKLNLAGPIKNNETIQAFFNCEMEQLEVTLVQAGWGVTIPISWETAVTGPERFYLVPAPALAVKQAMVELETKQPANRLLDIDVLHEVDGVATVINRQAVDAPVRKCLICEQPAKACGRARTHSVAQLQQRSSELMQQVLAAHEQSQRAAWLAQQAERALLYEVSTWPKPGLVDPVEHGAHLDMDHYLFIDSSLSMTNYLTNSALAGLYFQGTDLTQLFQTVREFGKRAEQQMFATTNGVNTHKGAVFTLGVLSAATGYAWQQGALTAERVQQTVKEMLVDLIADDLGKMKADQDHTAGENQYLKYGITGIRGEAAAGYPSVFQIGLPTLQATSGDWQTRILTTLLAIATQIEDSTLVHRAKDPKVITWLQDKVAKIEQLGGVATAAGMNQLTALQTEFSDRYLSLGGSADMLIATLFMEFVLTEVPDALSITWWEKVKLSNSRGWATNRVDSRLWWLPTNLDWSISTTSLRGVSGNYLRSARPWGFESRWRVSWNHDADWWFSRVNGRDRTNEPDFSRSFDGGQCDLWTIATAPGNCLTSRCGRRSITEDVEYATVAVRLYRCHAG